MEGFYQAKNEIELNNSKGIFGNFLCHLNPFGCFQLIYKTIHIHIHASNTKTSKSRAAAKAKDASATLLEFPEFLASSKAVWAFLRQQ